MNATPSIIVLRAGRAEAGIVPAIGGSLTHFHWTDGSASIPWLRPASIDDLRGGHADALACFPLVPYSNRVRNGRFTFEGRVIDLPRNLPSVPHPLHGDGWQRAWRVVDAAADRATIEHTHAADTWPFDYRARQQMFLTENELRITLSVENLSAQTMPVGLGLHPFFPSTPRCAISASVDAMWATDDEVMPTALVAADTRLASSDGMPLATTPLDNVFNGWKRYAAIRWPERNATLVLEADGPLDFLVIYSPRGEGYFCAEPVSHCTDAFNLAARGMRDTGMLALAPGATVSATVRLRPTA